MTRILPLLLLLACSPPDGNRDRRPATSSSATSLPTGEDDPRVVVGGAIDCDDPAAREDQVFDRVDHGAEWPKPPNYREPGWDIGIGGRGIGVGELTGDDWPDLLVPGHHQPTRLLVGGPEGFTEDPDAFDMPVDGHQGVTVADLDGDGDLDGILYAIDTLPAVLWNNGVGEFTVEQRPDWDDDHEYPCGGSASVADYDGDGVLDLFYGRLGVHDRQTDVYEPCDSMLLRGLGGGAFEDDTAQLAGELQEVRVLASGFHDFDGNGWLDLYAVADCAPAPQPNQLLLNDGGRFTYAPESGMNVRLEGMGLAVGDLNGDATPDVVVPGIDEYAALLSTDGDLWVDGANAIGLTMDFDRGMRVGWGLELADLDNDGHLDLATVFGRDRATLNVPWNEPNAIHRNLGDGTFEEVGAAWGFDEQTVERGLVVADLDRDGWLDLVTREVGGLVSVYTARCGAESWLGLTLRDEGTNPWAIGASVAVEAGGQVFRRTVSAGSTSYASGSSPEIHVGLGAIEQVDAIEVTWPDGEITRYGAIDARQRVELWRER